MQHIEQFNTRHYDRQLCKTCVSTQQHDKQLEASCRRSAAGFRMDNPSKIARGGDAPGLKQFHSCLRGDLDLAHLRKLVAAFSSLPRWRCNRSVY